MKLNFNAKKSKYIVSIITQGPNTGNKSEMLNYEMQISPLKRVDGYDHIEVHKTKHFLKESLTNDSSAYIMARAAETAEKIELKIDKTGKVQELLNFEDLKVKWYQIKSELEALYQNNDLIKHVDNVHGQINNPTLAWKIISKGLFFTLFFLDIYKNYDQPLTGDQIIEINDLLPDQAIHIKYGSKVDNDMLHLQGNSNSIKLSDANLKRFSTQDSTEEPMANAEIKIDYRFNLKSQVIEVITATLDCSIKDQYHKKILVDISNIDD